MRIAGYALAAFGLLIAMKGVLLDPSVAAAGARVANIQLLNQQLLLAGGGAALFLAGVVMVVGSGIVEAIERVARRDATPAPGTVSVSALPAGSSPAQESVAAEASSAVGGGYGHAWRR